MLARASAEELHGLLSQMAEQWRQDYRMGMQALPDRAPHRARRPGRFAGADPQR
jgi:hypothetical protein